MVRKRATTAALSLAMLLVLMGTSPGRVVSAITGCSGCSTDEECGDGATCCNGSCCAETCCGDAHSGTCTDLRHNDNCGKCFNTCTQGCLGTTCGELPACAPDAGWFTLTPCTTNPGEFGCVGGL